MGARPDADGDRLLRRKQVCALLGVCRHTLARIVRTDPTFPKFFELSPGIEVVRARAVQRWISSRELDARETAPTSPRLRKDQLAARPLAARR